MRTFARVAFFVSGVAGLTFEIVWLRHLGLALGATTLAVATTTAAYMGGLALGSHFGGRLADRLRRPLASYGAIEMAVALAGLAIPTLCTYIPRVDASLLSDLQHGSLRALVRFFVAALVLIVPTTAMGMTLPVLARAVTEKLDNVGREVGLLYAINIAGAVVGAALTGFVFVPALGLAKTNLVAVGLDAILGSVTVGAGLLLPAAKVSPNPTQPTPVFAAGGRLVVSVLAITGAAAMALQVLWTRAISTALGPSTYAFTTIVCAYLLGLAVGGSIAAWLANKMLHARYTLAAVLITTAFAVWFGTVWVDDLPVLLHQVVLDPRLTMGGLVRTEFGLAALSLLPATIAMGAIFPLTLKAVVGSEAHLGAAVGRAYAVNTLGNIAGSFAAAFVLLPLFGVEWGMRVAALGYVGAASLLVVGLEPSVRKAQRYWLGAALAAAAAALMLWPSWDIGRWTSGLYRLSMARTYFSDPDTISTADVIFHADGLSTTVTVEEESGVRWIKVNGKIDGSSEGDMPTQVLSGMLPMLVHPNPNNVAVIGCGSCVTVGAALSANPKHLTLIELEPEVVRAARLFASVNHNPFDDPRLTIVQDDGRNYMMRGGPSFDVIISEPSNPWMTGAASLFTAEFFHIAARRLAPGGMFLQWLQAYEMAPQRIASVLKTFQSVFPHVLVFSAHPDSNDLLLLGSRDPLRLPRAQLNARFAQNRSELERAEVSSVDELLALMLITDEELKNVSAPLNTDDNALIEFGAPRDLVTYAEHDPELPFLSAKGGRRAELITRLGGIDASPKAHLALAWGYLREGMLLDAKTTAGARLGDAELGSEAAEVQALADLLDSDDEERLLDPAYGSIREAYTGVVSALRRDAVSEALAFFDRKQGGEPPATPAEQLLYGYVLYQDEQYAAARYHFGQAQKAAPQLAAPAAYYTAKAYFDDGLYARAVSSMQEYRKAKALLSVASKEE